MNHTDYTARALINRQKRQRQVRYHIMAAILSLVLILAISILFI